jgi:DNA-directed RNA polymerase subunit RPC12/RpoP
MSRRIIKEQPAAYAVACARCGAETISTDRQETALCLICRAALLALNFQSRRTPSRPKKRRERRWLRMMVAGFGKPA